MHNKPWLKCLFLAYVAILTYLLFFSEKYGRNGAYTNFQFNLIPFREIRRVIVNVKAFGIWPVVFNVGGNIAAFVPYGFLLPYVCNIKFNYWKILLFGVISSLIVELIQLLGKLGVCDIDDIMLNTFGTILGYAIYRLVCLIVRKSGRRTIKEDDVAN